MAGLPDLPELFLSHSGEQKGFVQRLYRELLHVNHNPFFDQDTRPDSLPKGTPFPSRILDACRACKLGVVVLSHDYLESMWPMLELQQLLFHNPSSPNNVYPIFYKLKPADLCNTENLARWMSSWEKSVPRWHTKNRDWQAATSSNFTSLTLDVDRWPEALQMLRHQSGEIFPDNKDEHAFIQAIISNICKRFPPPESFLMGDHFKGAEHIQEEIHELFQKQQHGDQETNDSGRIPIAVGIYGVGGSGKTTVCRYMLKFYNKDYPGNCCFLQFPSKEADIVLLVQSLKDVLSKRGNLHKETSSNIQSVEEAMPHIQELLRRYRVFLIVDNVWNWSLDIAKAIITMDFMPGSRLLVTARSEGLLQILCSNLGGRNLPAMQIVHVPSISEDEAMGALMAYSLSSLRYFSNIEGLRGLARSCFYGEQCHPLLLKAVGTKLRYLGGQTNSVQDWTRLISNLQARAICDDEEIEDMIVNVLKTSYDVLRPRLQNTFLKLGTCVPKRIKYWTLKSSMSEWLSKVSDDGAYTTGDIRDQLMELKYHGLIQIHGEDVVIHDLQMLLIENVVRKHNDVPRCYLFEGDIRTLSRSECMGFRYVYAVLEERARSSIHLSPQKRWLKHMIGRFPRLDQSCPLKIGCVPRLDQSCPPNIEVYHLDGGYICGGSLYRSSFSVKHMQFLRHLCLSGLYDLIEVGGWHGAPNLVSVEVEWCKRLRKIESMTRLHRLESVVFKNNGRKSILKGSTDLTEFLGHQRKLQKLHLSMYKNKWADLQETLSAYTSLQKCILSFSEIVSFPNFDSGSLRVLDLGWSNRLQCMEGSMCGFTALEELDLRGCSELKSMPDLKQLVRLRRLELGRCRALREVKVGDAALTSLDQLSFDYGGCHLSTSSCSSPLPISAFTNLRSLEVGGDGIGHHDQVVDVGSMELPVSLEELHLYSFETAQECPGLSALVNLKTLALSSWNSLKNITGLGGLTTLLEMHISNCASLREVGHWEPPFTRYNLQRVSFWSCPQLETLSTIPHLPSLTFLELRPTPKGLLLEDMQSHFRSTKMNTLCIFGEDESSTNVFFRRPLVSKWCGY